VSEELPPLVTCAYSCFRCGIRRREVQVREREEGESVREWLDVLAAIAGADHAQQSPGCSSQKCDLLVPLASGVETFVGKALRQ
jgi:hypothetical protein